MGVVGILLGLAVEVVDQYVNEFFLGVFVMEAVGGEKDLYDFEGEITEDGLDDGLNFGKVFLLQQVHLHLPIIDDFKDVDQVLHRKFLRVVHHPRHQLPGHVGVVVLFWQVVLRGFNHNVRVELQLPSALHQLQQVTHFFIRERLNWDCCIFVEDGLVQLCRQEVEGLPDGEQGIDIVVDN